VDPTDSPSTKCPFTAAPRRFRAREGRPLSRLRGPERGRSWSLGPIEKPDFRRIGTEATRGYSPAMVTFAESGQMPEQAYEPPVLVEIGTVAELTLGRCWFGIKQVGGSDGFSLAGQPISISNCSS
jgi:hypothetical protein